MDSSPQPPLQMLATPDSAPLGDEDYRQLEAILDDLASRGEGIPRSWEYCDGFLTALLCCRRLIPPSAYFPVLFGGGADDPGFGQARFRDAAQLDAFAGLWFRRWNEVAAALQAPVESLDDERALVPYLIDVRAAVAALPAAEREALTERTNEALPAFGQYWAIGFTDAVEAWLDDWRAPRERELAQAWDDALDTLYALTDDDTDPPALNPGNADGPPTVSEARWALFGEALWAVYDLYDIAREAGPPIEPIRRAVTPGRNDPCPCGSGKKYKKCCGAA
jgi:uncharacterized protein